MNDRRAAIWSYMPIFNKEKNRWQGHYLAYTCDFDVAPTTRSAASGVASR